MKYYHFHADGRTVREISPEQYYKLLNRGEKSKRGTSTLAKVSGNWIFLRKGHNYVWIKKRQIEQVLGKTPQLPLEPQQTTTQQNSK